MSPLSTVMSLLDDQRVATVELGGERFATGLITHSTRLSEQAAGALWSLM